MHPFTCTDKNRQVFTKPQPMCALDAWILEKSLNPPPPRSEQPSTPQQPPSASSRGERRRVEAGDGTNNLRRSRRRGRSAPAEKEHARPASPTTWLKTLSATASQPLETEASKTFHKEYYYHPKTNEYPLGKIEPHHTRGQEQAIGRIHPVTKIGLRAKTFGSLRSGYGQQCNDRERRIKLVGIQGVDVQPILFLTELNRLKISPSLISKGVIGSFVGGQSTHLRHTLTAEQANLTRPDQRDVGLYEESYPEAKSYVGPKYGMKTSDVTAFADAAVIQAVLMRK